MAELKYFTPILKWLSVVADEKSDVDADPQTKGIFAGCTVIPTIAGSDARAVRAEDLTPSPALLALAPFEARLDDGRLMLRADSDKAATSFANVAAFPGTGATNHLYRALDTDLYYEWTGTEYVLSVDYARLRLLANCPVLELPDDITIWYEFRFHHVTYNGSSQALPTIMIAAPTIAEDHDDLTDGEIVVNLATSEWIGDLTPAGGEIFVRNVPDDVQLVGEDVQFYRQGVPIGDPLPLVEHLLLVDHLNQQKKKVNVCDGLWSSSPSTITTSGYTWKTVYNVQVDACDIQLLFAQSTVTATGTIKDTYPAAAATFSAAIEYGGVVYPVFFQGLKSVTVQPGGIALCDPIGITVTKGTTIAVRFYGASGTLVVNKQIGIGGLAGTGGYASGDFTASGAGAVADVSSTQTTIPGATAIIGYPTSPGVPKAVVGLGDSIMAYAWDGPGTYRTFTSAKPYLGGGWLQRSLQGVGSVLNIAAPSDRASYFLDGANSFLRSSLLEYARFGVIGYGINDLNSGQTYLQVAQSNLTIAQRNFARGVVKSVLTTITPYVTATDRITTLVNQTPFAYNSVRVAYNTWVRAGGPIDPDTLAPVAVGTTGAKVFGDPLHPVAGYLEVADAVESSRDSGKWRVDGIRTVSDAAWASGTTITSATGAFTGGDVGKDFVIAGVGAAGVDYYGVIDAVTSSTTFTIPAGVPVPSTVASGQFMAIGKWTREGLHPTAAGHAAISSAVSAPLTALLDADNPIVSSTSFVIGMNVQAWDEDLSAIAAQSTTAFGRAQLANADAAAARAAIGAGVNAFGIYVAESYGTVDYTGATFSDAAIAAAVTARGTSPGTIVLGMGTVKLNNTINLLNPGQRLQGQGKGATHLDYRGTSIAVDVRDSTVDTLDGDQPGFGNGVTGLHITGANNANTNIAGLRIGDVMGSELDVFIDHFQTSGSVGLWAQNRYQWSEWSNWKADVEYCTTAYLFDIHASHAAFISTFAYSRFDLHFIADKNQNGVVVQNNAAVYSNDMFVVGNCLGSKDDPTQTGVALTVGTSPGDTAYFHGHVNFFVETNDWGQGHKDINVGAAATFDTDGRLLFSPSGSVPFVAGSATEAKVKHHGRIYCQSLGQHDPGFVHFPDSLVVPAYAGIYNGTTRVLEIGNFGSANHFVMEASGSGSTPVFSTDGSDGTIGMTVNTKGQAPVTVNANLVANAHFSKFTTIATAAGTTTLTTASTQIQEFTGSTTQTVLLPTTSLPAGAEYLIINNSTGLVTVQSSNGTTVRILENGTSAWFQARVATPTTGAHWDSQYIGFQISNGKLLSVANTMTFAGTDFTSITFPGTSTTLVGRAGTDTITGVKTFSTAPVLNALPSGTAVASAATASTLATRDAQANLTADNFIATRTSTATAAGTATLTIDSSATQVFTGSTTQTVLLPTTSVIAGQAYTISNQSSGAVTVQSSGANAIVVLSANKLGVFIAQVDTPTTAAHWLAVAPTASSVASTVPLRDANATLFANGFLANPASTVTAAGTTTLTVASGQIQIFTGSTTQTVKLPTSFVTGGWRYTIVNQSSGAVTVQSSGANTIATVAANSVQDFVAIASTPTTAADWRAI